MEKTERSMDPITMVNPWLINHGIPVAMEFSKIRVFTMTLSRQPGRFPNWLAAL